MPISSPYDSLMARAGKGEDKKGLAGLRRH
jgi:hypothetical protein